MEKIAKTPSKILVIQLKMIGDVLISSMICNNLRKRFPDAQIDYLIYPFTKPVVENNPNIDRMILFPDAARESKIELLKFVSAIHKSRYDIVIDAYSKLESCLVTMFSGAERRIGYEGKGIPFSYNEKVFYPKNPKTIKGLAIERREQLFAGLMGDLEIDPYPKIFLTQAELATADVLLLKHGISSDDKLVMVSILGSEESKTYPLDYMAQLIDRIADEENVRILFNYIPKQVDEARRLFELCSHTSKSKIVFDLIGTDLRSFMAIMSFCKIIVGNDGGAINIAKALNKPSFTIFSPWIEKKSWSIFEDGIFHKAVHLNDFRPELIGKNPRKDLKTQHLKYYKMFNPELITNALTKFLRDNL